MNVVLEFSGGAELLFGKVRQHTIVLPNTISESNQSQVWSVGQLLAWIKENLLRERPELFLKGKVDVDKKQYGSIQQLRGHNHAIKSPTQLTVDSFYSEGQKWALFGPTAMQLVIECPLTWILFKII